MGALYYNNPNSVNHLPAHERAPEAERRRSINSEYNNLQDGKITQYQFDNRMNAINAKAAADKESNRQKAQAENYSNNQTSQPSVETNAKSEDVKAAKIPLRPSSPSSPTRQSAPPNRNKGSWQKTEGLFDAQGDQWSGGGVMYTRQQLPFMFEVWNPAQKGKELEYQAVLPFNPESYRMTYNPRASTTYTQGGVYEDNIGISPPKFQISGVFGLVGTTLVGVAKSLEKEAHSGMYLYHEMEKNLLEFYERFGLNRLDAVSQDKPVDMSKPQELRFLNFCDQEYWIVQINQFTLTRNVQRRHLYQYDIQMTGLKRIINAGKEEEVMEQMITSDSDRNLPDGKEETESVSTWDKFMQSLQGGVSAITGPLQKGTAALNKVMGEVGKLKGMMTQLSTSVGSFKNGLTYVVHAPKDLITTALSTVQSIQKSAQDIASLPHEFLNDMRNVQRLLQNYNKHNALFKPPITTAAGSLAPTTVLAPEIMTTPVPKGAESAGFVAMNIPEETIFATQESNQQVANKQQTVAGTDTIYTIAQLNGVNWQDIAILNGLEAPFIAKTVQDKFSPIEQQGLLISDVVPTDMMVGVRGITATPGQHIIITGKQTVTATVKSQQGNAIYLEAAVGVACSTGDMVTVHSRALNVASAGDVILIPATSQNNLNIAADSQDAFERRLFGVDEYLDNDGDMAGDVNGELVTISGMSNLEMQLRHRVVTQRGELAELGHPEYGSLVPTLIGKMGSPVWYERILLECQMAVQQDPRVQSLGNVSMTVDNTQVMFSADVLPIGQTGAISVSFPIT